MIVYGRQPVREAAAGSAPRSSRVWATQRARGGVVARDASTRDLRRRGGSRQLRAATHQGICAETEGYPYVGAAELLAADCR